MAALFQTRLLARTLLPQYGRAVLGAGRKAVLVLALALPVGAHAQSNGPVPERFTTMQADTDFPGGDLTPVFDTTLVQCHATCLRMPDCTGFTFNQRNGSCFPKSLIGESTLYEGAVSGVVSQIGATVLTQAPILRQEMDFLERSDIDAAREMAETMANRHFANRMSEAALLDGARARSGSDAVNWSGAAVTVADSGQAWLAYARALSAHAENSPNTRFELNRRATNAAINAALRLNDGPARAQALVQMAASMEAVFRGDMALAAMRLADRLSPGIAGDDLARLREQYGFRFLSHDVDALTATPRICASFSDGLSPSRDYAPFVHSAVQGLAVEVEGQQLCLTGLQYGETYSVTFRAGLPAASGDTLVRDVPLDVYVRDRTPLVRFPGRGYVLPVSGPRALPVETVNADRLELRLLRVSDRNLVAAIRQGNFAQALSQWEGERFENLLAEPVWDGVADLEGVLNRTATSRLPLDDVGPLSAGVYVLRAAVPGTDPYDVPAAMQWFMVSDLGVTSYQGSDGMHVVVQRLSDGTPADGARVALLAQSNRVLAEGQSDAQGHIRFAADLLRGRDTSAPAMILVETEDQDMAVLSLTDPEFDLSDRGVEGRAAPGAVDVFLTTDRGAYRAAEVINATALVRDNQTRAIHGLPLIARLLRPDGVEYSRILSTREHAGGHVFAMPLGGDVPRGVWQLEILSDPEAPALAMQSVLVEDFLPERVDFDLDLSTDGPIDIAALPTVAISARHLFGPPAAGLALSGTVTLRPVPEFDGWPGFRFGRHDQRLDPQRRSFDRGVQTDAAGRISAPLPLDGIRLENRPYAATVTATLLDGASRPVERSLTRALRPAGPVLGIRPGFDDTLPENAQARFDLVLVGPDGAALPGNVQWQVDKVETRYQWYSLDGRWNWEPVTSRSRVAEGEVMLADGPEGIVVPVDWGNHELRVTHEGAELVSASVGFAAGWFAADTARDTPDMLTLALDQPAYAPGDVARLRIVAEEDGMALVSVLSDHVVDMQLVAVSGETVIDLPVTDDWGTGAYVTASLIRPSDSADQMPARALGLVHAPIAPGTRALNATLDTPAEAAPRGPLNMALVLENAPDGPVYATVAAVDLGVLTLTGFDSPDPHAYFFGQRGLGVAIRDMYGRLIDARQGAMGQVRSGGDASAAVRSGPAPAEDILSLFYGPVALENGRADLSFDLPAFNGTVRVMAVVWSDDAVGQASADVLVRDPVVVQPSLPRFMTPGDSSRLRLELTHAKGATGEMALQVTGHGLGDVPASVTLGAGETVALNLPLQPTEPGDHAYQITLTTPDGDVLTRDVALSVQYTDPQVARSSRFTLEPGQSFSFDAAALDGLRAGTGRATLVAGAGAALDVAGLIQRLNAYPYGCTEQIASGIQPLLLAAGAVVELGLMTEADVRTRLQDALDRILTRQDRRGSFGLWGGGGGSDLWLDAYVTDVLLRADAQGAQVPATALRMALNNLRNQVAQAGSLYDGAGGYAYAFEVLARAGEAAIGDLRYYADTLADKFDTPIAAAQLGAALAAYGEQVRADGMFTRALALTVADETQAGWRGDYGTPLRDRAAVLALAVDAGSAVPDRVRLAAMLSGQTPTDQLSPQEAAWTLRAAVALDAQSQGLSLNGQPAVGNVVHLYDGQPAQLRNDGAQAVAVTLTAFGVPETAPQAGGTGYTISRSYFTTDGDPAGLDSLHPGDRLVTLLEIRPDRGIGGGRLMVDDALPAGFEIDNANLLRDGDIRALDWLNTHDYAEMTEARADRFLAAVDWTSDEPLRLAYIVRAVSPGEFHHPAAKVEDMYRPTRRAITGTGRVRISP
ncbi:alpha-2-macroglobulin family protein [Roseinatronobacter alkalisoli]|uniref:Alpha-2-macroglobulin family protein n=1 Tax=Roseinatronobacter alkalisoli TaxID=3028235 RepID=A0ABT5T3A3_9RHOB|nr:alpha-2-macroglobulin family protein [Roseinatronobacter sp. HJB301]MDD7969599.1 alpha-2-macroglobulin family protein [Roseinatronobacter sp. HJB301]